MKTYQSMANIEDVYRYCEFYHINERDIWKATNWDEDVIEIEFKDGSVLFYRPLGDEIIWPPIDIPNDPEERSRLCFGEMLKSKIKRSNLKQGEFAKLLGITEVSLSHYVNGKAFPKMDVLYKMAETLKMPVDAFCECFRIN